MRMEHTALYVHDLERARAFFEAYSGAQAGNVYHNPKTGFRSYFLSFEDGARLEVMNRPDLADVPKDPERTGYAHVAFSAGSREAVEALTERLRGDGYRVVSGPRTTGDGYYESCVLDEEGNRVEITV